eukprot:4428251-Pyramimonas_sp.AAC.1
MEQHDVACKMLLTTAQAWRRLVFYFSQPKFSALRACEDGADEEFIKEVSAPLQSAGAECSDCLDDFSEVWVRRLTDPELMMRARMALRLHVAAIPT